MVSRAEESKGRDNNFNLLRILAAVAVLISHAYPIALGPNTPEPLDHILGMSLGTLSVLTFFAISGYFISQSYQNKRSLVDFAIARVLRIYPGLLLVLLITVLILGPVFTTASISAYFSDSETLLYLPQNLRLWPLRYDLPGVFDDNPYPKAVNGSLWTLAYEVGCYTMVAVVATIGLTEDRRRFTVFLIAYATWYVATLLILCGHQGHFQTLRNIHLLTFPFVIGMSLFQFRNHVKLRLYVLVFLGAASAFSYGSPWFHQLFVLAWSYGVFYLGFLKLGPLAAYNYLGDYSYGTYIYGFPMEQIVAALHKECTPLRLIILSLPPTIIFAIFSWHLIEERALAQRSSILNRLRRYSNTRDATSP